MSRPLEEQLRALADRNVSGAAGHGEAPLGEYARDRNRVPHGRRAISLAVAAMVFVVGGIAAVVLTGDESTIPVTSGPGTYLVPPLDATDISGIQVPGGSTINFTVAGQPYQLTQIDGDAVGNDLSDEELEAMKGEGAHLIEVNGIGSVYVHCGRDLTIDGDPEPQANPITAATWLEGPLSVDLLARGDDTERLCAAPDLNSSPLVETVRALRRVDDTGWHAYLAANGIEDVSTSLGPDRSCLSAGQGEVCAERDDAVLLTATGLEPGSTFTYKVQSVALPDQISDELIVTAAGDLPGLLGMMSAIPTPVTITVSATSADGETISGPLSLQ